MRKITIRILGHPSDVEWTAAQLRLALKIEDESEDFKNDHLDLRSDQRVRRYLVIKPPGARERARNGRVGGVS